MLVRVYFVTAVLAPESQLIYGTDCISSFGPEAQSYQSFFLPTQYVFLTSYFLWSGWNKTQPILIKNPTAAVK